MVNSEKYEFVEFILKESTPREMDLMKANGSAKYISGGIVGLAAAAATIVTGGLALPGIAVVLLATYFLNQRMKKHFDICEQKCSRGSDSKTCFNKCYAEGAKNNLELLKRDMNQAKREYADNPKKLKSMMKHLTKQYIKYNKIYQKAESNGYSMKFGSTNRGELIRLR